MKKLALISLSFFFAVTTFAGDVLTLNNEMKFEGKIIKIDKNCNVTFKATDDNKYVIPAADILTIEFENTSDSIYMEYLSRLHNDPDACMKGHMDARNYHGKTGGHIAAGILFGPFAIIVAAASNPTPQKGEDTNTLSQNRELFNDPNYLHCYSKEAKKKNVQNTAIGWGMWILFILLIL